MGNCFSDDYHDKDGRELLCEVCGNSRMTKDGNLCNTCRIDISREFCDCIFDCCFVCCLK